jgi:tetraacyldisaccharide 4'-kinase
VISVGNIVAGGAGKSPVARWVARVALDSGLHPMIALRGYRSIRDVSDEAEEHRRLLPTVPVAVGADRHACVLRTLDAHPQCNFVVLDDGFQHRRLARDFDLVLVNGAADRLESALLPHGWLREPPSALRRASAVLVTRAAHVDAALARAVEAVHGRPPIAWCDHVWERLDLFDGVAHGSTTPVACEWLNQRAIAVWAAVADGSAIARACEAQGARVVHAPKLRDHTNYTPELVAELGLSARREGATAVLATGKDWSTLAPHASRAGLPFVIPALSIRVHEGADALRFALRRVFAQR